MVTKQYLLLLVFSVFTSGCSHIGGVPKDRPLKTDMSNMIKIKEVTLTDETLNVVYEVVNPFEDDIRICQDINVYGGQHVATRIHGEEVFLKLHINLEHENAFWEPQPVAKYFRLRPGETHSGRILLKLPIENTSPVKFFRDDRKKLKQVYLNRCVLEVGYFGTKTNRVFVELPKLAKKMGIEGGITIDERGWHHLPISPFITEENQDGQSREVVYIRAPWDEMCVGEKVVKAAFTVVDMPCLAREKLGN